MEYINGECGEKMDYILQELENVQLCGPLLQRVLRLKAHMLVDEVDEELKMILNLVESHIPGLRFRAEIEYETSTYEEKSVRAFMKRDHINPFSRAESDIDILLQRVSELPKEWTVIQITPQYSSKEIFAVNLDELTIYGVHITTFNCGEKDEIPYCVTLPGGNAFSLRGDMKRLKDYLKEIYSLPYKKAENMTSKSKKMYYKKRLELEETLETLLQEIEDSWLGAWRCLLLGKYVDSSIETNIRNLVDEFLKEKSLAITSNKLKNILIQAVKMTICSNTAESIVDKYCTTILEYCFPGKNLSNSWKIFWKNHHIEIQRDERHPVILIVDEALDAFPWEMISILNGQPSSRMPSLHLLYALYKAHEDTIVDGYKIISDCYNGKFILNPGLDLQLMEKRLKAFFDYWLPEWNGMAGKTPSTTEFLDALTSTECFCYSGHGSGAQYCSSEKIQKEKIDSVVLLFGCGSTQLVEQGASVEMYGTSQMYSLAGCPCLIGMLFVVTDIDTDVLTTNLLSTWIPNKQQIPWQLINEKEWIDKGIIVPDEQQSNEVFNEPNLLKALCIAKDKMKHKCNKAAVVARGIPVKLVYK